MRFHADGLDDGVGAASVAEPADLITDVLSVFVQIDGVYAPGPGPGQPFGYEIDTDDLARTAVKGDPGRHVANRTESEHGDAAAWRNVGVDDGLQRGGQDVGEVEEPLIGWPVLHLDRQRVAERDPQQLRLAAGHLAVELGEAEERGPHSPVLDLRGLAL